MNTIAIILSGIGTVCACLPPLLKGKTMRLILLFLFLSNALIGASYVLTGAFSGAVSCGVGAAQTIINYGFDRRSKAIPVWLVAVYAAAFVAVNLLTFSAITDIFALLACMAFVLSISQKSGKQYRISTIANAGLWAIYDVSTLSFGPLATHLLLLTMAVCGMIIHDRKEKTSPTAR